MSLRRRETVTDTSVHPTSRSRDLCRPVCAESYRACKIGWQDNSRNPIGRPLPRQFRRHKECFNPRSYVVNRWSEELMMEVDSGEEREGNISGKQNTIAHKQKIVTRWCGMCHQKALLQPSSRVTACRPGTDCSSLEGNCRAHPCAWISTQWNRSRYESAG